MSKYRSYKASGRALSGRSNSRCKPYREDSLNDPVAPPARVLARRQGLLLPDVEGAAASLSSLICS